ncbi:unnamed protein product [Macrosiphum euphorbiae]|uniref:Uncharacterized protein n=1 Tax=Macrosiphum euphorbiae TaxID=13131 RepID=A0AAV0WLS0_9HEMI|nr:unnamed protein product [Macrosiphum euphorbiae]
MTTIPLPKSGLTSLSTIPYVNRNQHGHTACSRKTPDADLRPPPLAPKVEYDNKHGQNSIDKIREKRPKNTIPIRIHNQEISSKPAVKYLGVHLDSEL